MSQAKNSDGDKVYSLLKATYGSMKPSIDPMQGCVYNIKHLHWHPVAKNIHRGIKKKENYLPRIFKKTKPVI